MRFPRWMTSAALTALVFIFAPHAHAAETPARVLIQNINSTRQTEHLSGYRYSFTLTQAAARHAQDMFKQKYFGHRDPSGRRYTALITGPATFTAIGENLAQNQKTTIQAVGAWLTSPGHRANLLSPQFTHVGTAVARGTLGGKQTTLYVAMFGRI